MNNYFRIASVVVLSFFTAAVYAGVRPMMDEDDEEEICEERYELKDVSRLKMSLVTFSYTTSVHASVRATASSSARRQMRRLRCMSAVSRGRGFVPM